MIAPRFGFFARDNKWAVENEGVAPDIDVENWPKDVIAGRIPSSSARCRRRSSCLPRILATADGGTATAHLGQAREAVLTTR
jgi:hypothetical protein